MQRSSDYYTKNRHGWDTTSNDYHAHLSRMERTPTLLVDAPKYPNVHMIFNNKVVYEEEQVVDSHKKKNVPEAQKKVHFVEQEKTVECDRNGDCKVVEESIDVEAEGFLQQKHKNFELCKWKTFKMH